MPNNSDIDLSSRLFVFHFEEQGTRLFHIFNEELLKAPFVSQGTSDGSTRCRFRSISRTTGHNGTTITTNYQTDPRSTTSIRAIYRMNLSAGT